MARVLITRKLQPVAKEILSKQFEVEENPTDKPLSRDELKTAVKKYDGILSVLSDRFDHEVLSEATLLKVISNYAAGLDNIDALFARQKGIVVLNLPDIVTDSTADLTFALFLSFIRRIKEASHFVLEGRWEGWEPGLFLGEELRGKKFGIIGYGKIGQAVAQRALGFGLDILVYARKKVVIEDRRIEQLSLEELYHSSDYISLHVPLTQETAGMIDLKAMHSMRKKPVLINMARGGIIKTDDLVIALREGVIRGAALDVTDPEPISSSHPLCRMNNCLILPHIGSATIECRTKMARIAAENLKGALS